MTRTDVRLIAHYANQKAILSDTCGFILADYSGTAVPDTERIQQIATGQLGFTDIGYSIAARSLDLAWVVKGGSNGDLFRLRELLNGIFRPQDTGGYVRLDFITPSPFRYSIDVYLNGQISLNGSDRSGNDSQRAGLSVVAPDLRFYNAVERTVSYNVTQANRSGWLIPWEINWLLSNVSSTTQGTFSVDYVSTRKNGAPEYPLIKISGPVTNPGVLNTTTNQTLRLTGCTLAAGQTVTFDLKNGRYGSDTPTIRDNSGVSLEQYLSNDSDVNFRLSPLGEYILETGLFSTGVNVLTALGTETTSSTNYSIVYKERYLGF